MNTKKKKYPKSITTVSMACVLVFTVCLFVVFQNNVSTLRIAAARSASADSNAPTKFHVSAAARRKVSRREQDQVQPKPQQQPPPATISCDRSHSSYDICSIDGPTVLDPTKSTFYVDNPNLPRVVEKLRPYPRKSENYTMARIKEVTLSSNLDPPKCEVQHNAPAFVFAAGGYTGNFFHDFNDGFIPLFITVNSIFPDRDDIVLVVATGRDWWVRKYKELLGAMSKYPIIVLEKATSTHCFSSATVGLMSHGFMTIDPTLIPTKKTFTHFRALLAKAYGRGSSPDGGRRKPRPRLVWVTRPPEFGRAILNFEEAKSVAGHVGFDVIVFEPKVGTSLREAYGLINSSHAMVGVHGAGLTHALFLRSGSVFLQVVPLGAGWVSEACFGKPARDMGLEYIEYGIGVKESSLADKYGEDNVLVKNPNAVQGNGWSKEAMDIYLKEQNVKLDLVRFRSYLKKAHIKAKIFMDREG